MSAVWLAFKPAYSNVRGAQKSVLGAHAFDQGPEVVRSVCGYAPTDKTNGPAPADARRCVWCARLLARRAA